MSDYAPVEAKIKKLRNQFRGVDDRLKIDSLERTLRREIANADLAGVDAVQSLIRMTESSIEGINTLLQWDEELTDADRKALMRERKVHLFWIDRMDPKRAQNMVAQIESIVDSQLKIKP